MFPIGPHRGTQLDHEHGRAHALARDIPKRQVKQAAVIGKVVEIAAYCLTRLGSPGQIIARYARREVRQEVRLDLGGHAQPFLHPPLFHARLQ